MDLDYCSPQRWYAANACVLTGFCLPGSGLNRAKSTNYFVMCHRHPQTWCATDVMCYIPMWCATDVMCYGATDVMRGYFAVWSESSLDLTDWTSTQERSCGLPFDLAVVWSDRLPTALHQFDINVIEHVGYQPWSLEWIFLCRWSEFILHFNTEQLHLEAVEAYAQTFVNQQHQRSLSSENWYWGRATARFDDTRQLAGVALMIFDALEAIMIKCNEIIQVFVL